MCEHGHAAYADTLRNVWLRMEAEGRDLEPKGPLPGVALRQRAEKRGWSDFSRT